MTERTSTLVKSAIFFLSSSGTGCSERHITMSGWMPMPRSSFTECWVGLVLISPTLARCGTSVRCM